jgi:hypothetical protein
MFPGLPLLRVNKQIKDETSDIVAKENFYSLVFPLKTLNSASIARKYNGAFNIFRKFWFYIKSFRFQVDRGVGNPRQIIARMCQSIITSSMPSTGRSQGSTSVRSRSSSSLMKMIPHTIKKALVACKAIQCLRKGKFFGVVQRP